MKVKISYAVDFEKVPAKMSELISEKLDEYKDIMRIHQNCADLLANSTSTNAYRAVVEMLHELRLSLSEIDQTLGDCSLVVEGYINALEAQAQAEVQTPPEPVSPVVTPLEEE